MSGQKTNDHSFMLNLEVIMSKKKTQLEFVEQIKYINPNIKIIGKYIDSNTKIECECLIDGHTWSAVPFTLIKGVGCPKCAVKKRAELHTKSHETFLAEMLTINPNIEILSKYTHNKQKVQCKCKVCSSTWLTSPHILLRGYGCPICNESHGEREIRRYLDLHNIRYESQKTYNGLLGLDNGLLSYDFFLPDYNILIEYQGNFHDGSVKYKNYSHSLLERQMEHDKRKRLYAKTNDITLIEIWYWDYKNIENILNTKIR